MVANALQRPTLVLNRNWQPVNVTSVARSLTMVFSGTARVVCPDSYQLFDWDDWSQFVPHEDEPFVQAVAQRFRVPEVITLVSFDRLPKASVTFSRRNIFKRDKFTCQPFPGMGRRERLPMGNPVATDQLPQPVQ